MISAGGRTRTGTPLNADATPSRWCVYQFHHSGEDAYIIANLDQLVKRKMNEGDDTLNSDDNTLDLRGYRLYITGLV